MLHAAVIVLGAGCYGAAMGWWRAPQQALFTAVKFPLILLLTAIGNALINGMLAPLLGLDIPFRRSFAAVVMSFAVASAILGAFARSSRSSSGTRRRWPPHPAWHSPTAC